MNIRLWLVATAVSVVAAGTVCAETIEVFQTSKCSVYSSGTVLTVGMDEALDPAVLDAPAFWFDASDTAGWTIEDGKVTEIPSRSSERSLLYAWPENWNGWTGVETSAPSYSSCDEESGRPCVDFGDAGSGRVLMFDGGVITNIGTVIAVFNARNWGGWLFGGPNTNEGIWSWHRGRMAAAAYYDGVIDYRNPIARTQRSSAALTSALFRQNGLPYRAGSVGWGGGWEVFSLNPTNETLLSATGLGFNDLSAGKGAISGGMKYSELLIYDRVLDNATVEKIERFLARKWGVDDKVFGKNGKAFIDVLYANHVDGGGMRFEVNVPAGREISVGGIRGGHNANLTSEAGLVKTGTGTLRIGDLSRYDGTVELRGGDIVLESAVTSAEVSTNGFVIPDGVACHFDVSRRDTMTLTEVDGVEYLERIDDCEGRKYQGEHLIGLASRGITEASGVRYDRRPWLSPEYETVTGLRMLDFGSFGSWGTYYSRGLEFYAGETKTNPYVFTTVIAAVGSQRGGGWICNNGFQRANQTVNETTGLLCAEGTDNGGPLSVVPYLSPTNGVAYLDGVKIENPLNTGYPDKGYHVLALQIPGSTPTAVGEYWNRVGGGLILGEFLAWNRPLTEKEILDVQNYLSVKWFGKSCAKIIGRGDDVPVVSKFAAEGDGVITVESGSARIDKLTVNARLVKKGAGTLYVNEITDGNGVLVIEEGAVKTGSEPALTAEKIAAAPSLRIDMTDTNGWTMVETNGTNFVKSIPTKGEAGVIAYHTNPSYYPSIRDEEDFVAKSGVPVLDFGEYTYYEEKVSSVTGESNCLAFDRNLESVRSVYMVWRLRPSSDIVLLGSSCLNSQDGGKNDPQVGTVHLNNYRHNFLRGRRPDSGLSPLWSMSNAAKAIIDGETYTNGVKVAADDIPTVTPLADSWQLVEVHSLSGVHASAIGTDRDTVGAGGFALAEVIIYERELSEREKTATRNYLMKKWFGRSDEELAPLPDAENDPPDIPELEVDGAVELGEIGVGKLTGFGSVFKTGDGEISVFDIGAFTGSVTVAGGTLSLTGRYRAEPKMATDGLRMRLAADGEGMTFVDNSDGSRGVLEWENAVGDGWKAVAPTGYVVTSSAKLGGNAPLYVENSELNALPVVDMPKKSCFRFVDPDGGYASVDNIRNVFWVLGSQRGGGFLLGGGNLAASTGREKFYAWHRGSYPGDSQSAGRHREDPVMSTSGYPSMRLENLCSWRKNGEEAEPLTTTLSGGWDMLSYAALPAIPGKGYSYPSASGLAFDGRIFNLDNPENYVDRAGNQALAEVLIYTNDLTETEILQTEAYLNCKWGLNEAVASCDYAVDLTVEAGAVVNLASQVSFSSIGGAGTVNGNLSSAALTADFLSDGFLNVNGVYTLPASPTVTLVNVPEKLPAEVKLLEAGGFEGLENCRGALADGETDGGKLKVRLRERDGALYARVNTCNMVIICR